MSRPPITLPWIAISAVAELLAWLLLRAAVNNPAEFSRIEGVLLGTMSAYAYILGSVLCLKIAEEYKGAVWMRCGWLAFAGTAAISAIRYLLDSYVPALIWPAYASIRANGEFRQAALLTEFTLLLAGITALWLGFWTLGLGFRLLRRDIAVMAVVMTLLVFLIFQRERLSEQHVGTALAVKLQLTSHIVLAMAAAGSIPLHRLCAQLSGGRMAQFMRLIVAYAVLRSGAIFVGMVVLGNSGSGWQGALTLLAWRSTPWIFALAALIRAGMAESIIRSAHRQRVEQLPVCVMAPRP